MGAWRYCRNCGNRMDHPSIRDVIAGQQVCENAVCDYVHHVEQHEKEGAAEQLIERIERIEAHLGLSK
jgi:hypothetical protein